MTTIKRIAVKNFKILHEVDFEPGKVNVLIGANGTGKSSVLEIIGILSAAVNEQVDDESLFRKGIRLGTPLIYKSSFNSINRLSNTIEITVDWQENKDELFSYKVNLQNSTENPDKYWSYFSESLSKNGEIIPELTRGVKSKGNTQVNFDNGESFDVDKFRGLLSFYKNTSRTSFISNFYDMFREYAIYTPSTEYLRGVIADSSQKKPIGLHGGRLSEAVNDLLLESSDMFGTMDIDELYQLIDWISEIKVDRPQKDMLPTGVPTPQRVIQFTDRYLKQGKNKLSSYDASEGALYILFILSLAMHKDSPKVFAIDNFDQAMNPRLVRATMELFCEHVIKNDRTAFITTHNPLALDGLDLLNNDIRLFTLDRTKEGYAKINRIKPSEKLEEHSLSRLWLSGALGGVPKL